MDRNNVLLDQPSLQVAPGWREEFRTWLFNQGCHANTITSYFLDLQGFSEWFSMANGQPFEPALLTSIDLRTYRTWTLEEEEQRGGKHTSAATWNRRRSSLRNLCLWIETTGPMRFNFDALVERLDEQILAPRWLTRDEERQVMRQAELAVHSARTEAKRALAIRDLAMIKLMRYAGLRIQEVARLEVGDLRLGDRKGWLHVRDSKRNKSRDVPLSKEAKGGLNENLALRGELSPRARVFTADDGESPLSTRAIEKRIELISEAAKVDALTPHALRHTCAKRMVDAGRPLTEVMRIMGHESLQITARYVEPGQEDLEEAVAAGELGKMKQIHHL